jgi:5-oxoprolinase (ATP-hydrolysing)
VWHFWIDRGGTFTDCVGRDPNGQLHVVKVPSSDEAPILGMRQLLGVPEGPLPACEVVLATTLGTNALLERRGAATALIVTRGFADLLAIGDQTRPELFALHVHKDPLLPAETIEAELRLDADGAVIEGASPRAAAELDDAVRAALARGATSFAISLLHGHRAPQVEAELAARIAALGAPHVVAAAQIGGEIGYLARTETALVDAYLTPLLAAYLAGLARALEAPAQAGAAATEEEAGEAAGQGAAVASTAPAMPAPPAMEGAPHDEPSPASGRRAGVRGLQERIHRVRRCGAW